MQFSGSNNLATAKFVKGKSWDLLPDKENKLKTKVFRIF